MTAVTKGVRLAVLFTSMTELARLLVGTMLYLLGAEAVRLRRFLKGVCCRMSITVFLGRVVNDVARSLAVLDRVSVLLGELVDLEVRGRRVTVILAVTAL